MLDRNDGHCIWVEQAVLDLLPRNMAHADADPPGDMTTSTYMCFSCRALFRFFMRRHGLIRDPGRGVFCDDAMDPVTRLWPKLNDTAKTRLVRDAMRDLNSVGRAARRRSPVQQAG